MTPVSIGEEILIAPTVNLSPEPDDDRPMLYIELNIGQGITERVLMCENQDPKAVIDEIAEKEGWKQK